jgi:putative toxin-antitoxin system antitoxin component (TIGR02293 family)
MPVLSVRQKHSEKLPVGLFPNIREQTWDKLGDASLIELHQTVKRGITANDFFRKITPEGWFNLKEWSRFLNTPAHAIEILREKKKKFDSILSDRILQIMLLNRMGIEVFGNAEKFYHWTKKKNIALGGISPESIMDSSFGITLVRDLLGRIAHGIPS